MFAGKFKHFVIGIVIIVIVGMILTVCTNPEQATAADSISPIKLRYVTHQADNDYMADVFIKGWSNKVEEVTDGKVKITIYWNQSLCKQADQLDSVIQGIADITWNCHAWTPGRFPLDTVAELPFLFSSGVDVSRAMWELYPKYLAQEYKDIKTLEVSAGTPQYLFSTKPIQTLEDIKGLKTYAAGTISLKLLKYLGAVPVQVPWVDQYDALQRGIIDAVLSTPGGIIPNQSYKAVKYVLDLNFGCTTSYTAMNKAKWESLPLEIQQKIDKISGLYMAELHGQGWDGGSKDAWEKLAKKDVQPSKISAAEVEKFKEAVEPLNDWWIANIEDKGLPGQAIYDEILQLSKKYAK